MKFNICLETNLDKLVQTSIFKEQHTNTAIRYHLLFPGYACLLRQQEIQLFHV